jgi:hypothetical protein
MTILIQNFSIFEPIFNSNLGVKNIGRTPKDFPRTLGGGYAYSWLGTAAVEDNLLL